MKTVVRRAGSNGTAAPPAVVRVAVYCRVSTDERLDMEFNSLDAQRAAVEAFIESQRGQGWQALPERYDDGGYTGANTDRPAFQRLMADIEAGEIDVVATYKLDRLSRSLLDFMKTMEIFQRRGVTFVSVTQQFNTTTSVGRFTLNLLASFAEFERETISERTRDKMAATRKRGLWTGGPVPLGYRIVEKRLMPDEAEVARVREIFQLFLDLKSVMAVVDELRRRNWRVKGGKGGPHTKASVRHLLTNPTYIGKVRSGGALYPGVHEPIVDEATWDAVQTLLSTSDRPYRAPSGKSTALLRGLLFCGACGSTMSPHFSQKRGRRYHSYVCRKYEKQGASACPGSRVPLAEIERFVVERIRAIGKDPGLVGEVIDAARRELQERKPALVAELAGLEDERTRLDDERRNLLDAVSKNGSGSIGLLGRLGDVEGKLAKTSRRLDEVRAELRSIDGQAIDEDDFRKALAQFDPVWDALLAAEKARIMQLLIESVRYDARAGEIEIAFRPGAEQALTLGGGKRPA